jgi:hypothetical protein
MTLGSGFAAKPPFIAGLSDCFHQDRGGGEFSSAEPQNQAFVSGFSMACFVDSAPSDYYNPLHLLEQNVFKEHIRKAVIYDMVLQLILFFSEPKYF